MADEFRKLHLIQAALQGVGMPVPVIHDVLAKLESLASHPEDFAAWNQPLDAQGMEALTILLTPEGRPLCEATRDALLQDLQQHFGITDHQIEAFLRRN